MQTEPANRASGGGNVRGIDTGGIRGKLPPETFLETDHPRLIRGGVACMHDVGTVREYVGFENQHQRRRWVLRVFADRAATLRDQTDFLE
jgi:hypothetical protein